MRRLIMISVLAASLLAPPALAASEEARFAVRGEVRAMGRSDDGRYALLAELRQTPSAVSAEGRFELKAVSVPEAGCDPAIDLFADGFEGG